MNSFSFMGGTQLIGAQYYSSCPQTTIKQSNSKSWNNNAKGKGGSELPQTPGRTRTKGGGRPTKQKAAAQDSMRICTKIETIQERKGKQSRRRIWKGAGDLAAKQVLIISGEKKWGKKRLFAVALTKNRNNRPLSYQKEP